MKATLYIISVEDATYPTGYRNIHLIDVSESAVLKRVNPTLSVLKVVADHDCEIEPCKQLVERRASCGHSYHQPLRTHVCDYLCRLATPI